MMYFSFIWEAIIIIIIIFNYNIKKEYHLLVVIFVSLVFVIGNKTVFKFYHKNNEFDSHFIGSTKEIENYDEAVFTFIVLLRH